MIIKNFKNGLVQVRIFDNREAMGECSGSEIANRIKQLQKEKDEINLMFAAAPSQNEVLQTLAADKDIDWSRINAFHMDEYVGLEKGHPSSFGYYLHNMLLSNLKLNGIYFIDSSAEDSEAEAERYAKMLQSHPIDICILGVGENGHIAFNDPSVADFNDPLIVKVVYLEDRSKTQQVNDGCFASADLVPDKAITVTVPGLLAATYMYCSVPGATKADAIKAMLSGEVSEKCPCSILTTRQNVWVYLDADSGSLVI